MGDRVAYGICLESKRGLKTTGGSNPPPSSRFMKAKRIADVQKIINSNAHWAALKEYNHIRVQLSDGKEISLLLTDKELLRAMNRADKNVEDLPKVSWIRDVLD